MNDSELEQLLKSASPPERSEEYWRDFPKRVTSKLHWRTAPALDAAPGTWARLRTALALGCALGAACVAIIFFLRARPAGSAISESDSQFMEARACYRELNSLFPNQLRAIVFDRQGPRMVLADQPVVPESTPYYLNVCGPGGCKHFVTFSGQQIEFDGERCEVLADVQGQVMLVGSRHVWSQGEPTRSVQVNARPLEAIL